MEEFKPGQVISPQSAPAQPGAEPVAPLAAPTMSEQSVESPVPQTEPVSAGVPSQPAPAEGWQFHSESGAANSSEQTDNTTPTEPIYGDQEALDWTAAEFIAHDKSAGWYGLLALAALVATAIIYFITHDKISASIVVLAAIFLGAFASRKPKMQQYSLREDGIGVGQKVYYFHDFKTFSVAEEGASASVIFMPLKRFMPPLTIYVTPELADQVVDFLSAYLPFTQHKSDAVDSLLRRIRF